MCFSQCCLVSRYVPWATLFGTHRLCWGKKMPSLSSFMFKKNWTLKCPLSGVLVSSLCLSLDSFDKGVGTIFFVPSSVLGDENEHQAQAAGRVDGGNWWESRQGDMGAQRRGVCSGLLGCRRKECMKCYQENAHRVGRGPWERGRLMQEFGPFEEMKVKWLKDTGWYRGRLVVMRRESGTQITKGLDIQWRILDLAWGPWGCVSVSFCPVLGRMRSVSQEEPCGCCLENRHMSRWRWREGALCLAVTFRKTFFFLHFLSSVFLWSFSPRSNSKTGICIHLMAVIRPCSFTCCSAPEVRP